MLSASSHTQFVTAIYKVKSTKSIEKAAHDIAIGQSIGNPDIRTPFDNDLKHLTAKHEIYSPDHVVVHYPKEIFTDQPSINHILCVLMGGQTDIGHITECRLERLQIDCLKDSFPGPRFGIHGVRTHLRAFNRPLIGGILKPKIGLNAEQTADVCKQMADGGIDFIKEDEILYEPTIKHFKRIDAVARALQGYKVFYAPCVTADSYCRNPRLSESLGSNACHLNVWSSLGAYRTVREGHKFAIHFQKSGEKVWTTGPYSINPIVLFQLVNLVGCDFAHVGMYGGYSGDKITDLKRMCKALGNTIPAFSCGATPDHVKRLSDWFGKDIMVSAGGYIHGHKKGITEAVKEFREAADKAVQTLEV